MNQIAEEILMHYGMPKRSGRYPYGSGEDPYQHSRDFLGRIEELKKQNFTFTDEDGNKYTGDTAIAKSLGLSTSQFRTEVSIAKAEQRSYKVDRAKSLKEDGLTDTEIGRQMGVNESTVRSWLNEKSEQRMLQAKSTADYIKSEVDKKKMVDVGRGVEKELNISHERLEQALYLLERDGYVTYNNRIEQATNKGNFTTQKVICHPDIQPREGAKAPAEIYDADKVHSLKDYISRDGGDTYEKKFHYPESLDSKRLKIRYNEEGGLEKDGIIEIRRGCDDLSLGESRYSQVRILVDKTHYLKGMAVYSDDLPDGVDVVFNTNKTKGTPQNDVLKKIKNDPDNPFGSLIKDADQGGQYWYEDKKTGEKKLGLINKRADQGDWTEWKDALPSQFLGKQSLQMINKQLNQAKDDKKAEFDAICEINNPTIKKHFLQKFSDECDSAAVHLQAAALPGQKYHVIIPINSLKDNEVYAPGYEPGTKLALIRYPHGGTFEIPILTVNNKNPLGNQIIGKDSIDAVGINSKIANRLSGADFDGDTVMCIPTHDKGGKVKVTSTEPTDPLLRGIRDFDPKLEYKAARVEVDADGVTHAYKANGEEFKIMKNTGTEMGKISNLITDMTLKGAKEDELARAVRHSMVVIDAEKHKLDYKQSEKDHNIAALRKEYQPHADEDGRTRYGGASTILSRSKGEVSVDKRQGTPKVNQKGKSWYDPNKPEGSLIYKTADDVEYQYTKVNKRTGEETVVTKRKSQASTRMAETDDANTLVSEMRHPKELAYADYANSMKALANQARLEMVSTGKIAYSATAKRTYENEVKSLNEKLDNALVNAPREREAQRRTNAEVARKKTAYYEETGEKMKTKDVKKLSQQALTRYRTDVDAISRRKRNIEITDREWDAIQAGAVSENILNKILANTDIDKLRDRATPRSSKGLTASNIARIKRLSASNYTLEEIAKKMGVSTSTVSKALKE